jgi:hypothetical protein
MDMVWGRAVGIELLADNGIAGPSTQIKFMERRAVAIILYKSA